MTVRTPDWVKDAIFYQIFPDRFARSEQVAKPTNLEPWDSPPTRSGFKGGDLIGILERLDYLIDLGINAIYLNPIFQSVANHRYHTHDYFQVDPILGGNAAFETFLDAAHDRGIKVVLDGVFNHASRGFLQFNHILENGKHSPYVDWFIVKRFPLLAYDAHRTPNYAAWWNLRELPKLNTDNPQVREFLMRVAEYWIRRGIDGWRLDVPLEIKTPGFWKEFRERVKAINPDAYILAEIWDDAESWLQGEHFDATMNYGFNRACYGFFGDDWLDTSVRPGGYTVEPMEGPAFSEQIMHLLNLYDWEVTLAQYNLLSSHDEPRFLTMVDGDRRRLRLATLFQMTFPGVPSIYYGDEIGMVGGPDPDCRRAFPWDERHWDLDLHEDFRRFVALRRAHPALRRGSYTELHVGKETYAFARRWQDETIVVVLNAGEDPAALEIDLRKVLSDGAPHDVTLPEVWADTPIRAAGARLALTVPALEGRVFVQT
ncbi:MAG: alpha-amylase family glycosyl hydrolase [Anaerolineae bacterium]